MKKKLLILVALMNTFSLFAAAPAPIKQIDNQSPKEVAHPKIEESKEEGCPICLTPLKDKPTKIIDCHSRNPQSSDHSFHTECIDEWLERNPRCPMCRTEVPANEIPQRLIHDEPAPIDYNRGEWENAHIRMPIPHVLAPMHHRRAQENEHIIDLLNQTNDGNTHVQRLAQLQLALIYRQGGRYIAPNFELALLFYNQANQLDAPIEVQRRAQQGIGLIYLDGVPQNLERARYFLNQAHQPDAPEAVRSNAGFALERIARIENSRKKRECVIQ